MKKDFKRMIKKVNAELRNPEAYLEPKTQRAFEGIRGQLAQLYQRMGAVEDKLTLMSKQIEVFEEKLYQTYQTSNVAPLRRVRR